MEISILLMKQIAGLVLMGLAGYAVRKTDIISHEGSRGLSAVCVYLCTPCAIFLSFQTHMTKERLGGFFYALLAVSLIHLVFFLVMGVLKRLWSMNAIESTSVIYSNAGNLIIPLVAGVFGEELVFYTSAYMFVQSIFMWSHGQIQIRGTSEGALKKIFLHPCILSIFAGVLFLVLGWTLPYSVHTAVSGLGACMGPTAMLTVGMLIAELDLGQTFANRRIYLVTALRLLLFPFLAMITAFLLWKYFPFRISPDIYLIVTLGACGPAATSLTQLAQLCNKDPGYASSINVLTTFGSILTMPLIILLAQSIL